MRVFPPQFSQFAPIAVPTGAESKREFSDPRSFLPLPNRGVCPISEVVRVVYLGRLPVLSWPEPSNHPEAGIDHEPRPSKVRFRLGYIDRFIE